MNFPISSDVLGQANHGQPTKIHRISQGEPLVNPLHLPGRPSATPRPRRARAARRGAAGMWGSAAVVGPGHRS